MTVTVRAAVAEDLASVLDLYRQLHPELDLRPDACVERAWEATLATPDRTVLLADVGGRPAGTADVTLPADVAHAGQPHLLVEDVVVDAAHRRRGVGRALLAAAEGRAAASGCYEVQLSAVDDEALAFSEDSGMAARGRTYERHVGRD